MNINFNVPAALIERIAKAIEQLADDYRYAHTQEIRHARELETIMSRKVKQTQDADFFYQDDRRVYEREQLAKKAQEQIYGPPQ